MQDANLWMKALAGAQPQLMQAQPQAQAQAQAQMRLLAGANPLGTAQSQRPFSPQRLAPSQMPGYEPFQGFSQMVNPKSKKLLRGQTSPRTKPANASGVEAGWRKMINPQSGNDY